MDGNQQSISSSSSLFPYVLNEVTHAKRSHSHTTIPITTTTTTTATTSSSSSSSSSSSTTTTTTSTTTTTTITTGSSSTNDGSTTTNINNKTDDDDGGPMNVTESDDKIKENRIQSPSSTCIIITDDDDNSNKSKYKCHDKDVKLHTGWFKSTSFPEHALISSTQSNQVKFASQLDSFIAAHPMHSNAVDPYETMEPIIEFSDRNLSSPSESDHRKKKKRRKDESKKRKKEKSSKHHEYGRRDKYTDQSSSAYSNDSRIKKLSTGAPRKVFLEELQGLGYDYGYRLDRSADKDNYIFQALNKRHIAKHRSVSKIPFGISRKDSQAWRKPMTSKELQNQRYHAKQYVTELFTPGETSVPEKDLKHDNLAEPVLSVPRQQVQGAKTSSNPLGVYDRSTELWTQGKQADKLTEVGTDDVSTYAEYSDNIVAQKTAEYNRLLREDPSNVSLWLEFIKFQDNHINSRTADDTKMFTKQAIHDKKMAILDQAINKNPGNIELKMYQLEACKGYWDVNKITQEWKKLTFNHVNDAGIWRRYLHHICSDFARFSMPKMMKAYGQCLSSLRKIADGVIKSHPCLPNTEQHMLDILMDLCQILNEASHTERAVGLLQGMVEFNWFNPSRSTEHQANVEMFESFWDSGLPRFGEPGAKGWKNSISSDVTERPAPLKSTVEQDSVEEDHLIESCEIQNLSKTEIWLKLEEGRQTSHWLPWRPAAGETDDDCEDPFRLVLSDDLSPLLFYIKGNELRVRLCFEALHFFGIPSISVNVPNLLIGSNQLNLDLGGACQSVQMSNKLLINRFIGHCLEQLRTVLPTEHHPRLTIAHMNYRLHQVLILEDEKIRKSHAKELKRYAKSILSLPEHRSNHTLWLAYANIEQKLGNWTDAKKVFNALLTSLTCDTGSGVMISGKRLVSCWKYCESEMASPDAARDSILGAMCWLLIGGQLSMSATPSQVLKIGKEFEQEIDRMWQTTSKSMSRYAKVWKAVTALLTAMMMTRITDAIYRKPVIALLVFSRCQKHHTFCSQLQGSSGRSVNAECLCLILSCYVLTLALTRGMDDVEQCIQHWIPLLAAYSEELKHWRDSLHNLLLNIELVMQYSRNHISPSCHVNLRAFLQRAVHLFPESPQLLLKYLDVERSCHVTTRVRQFFTSSLLAAPPSERQSLGVMRVFAIYYELCRLSAVDESEYGLGGGASHRIRSLCESSLTAEDDYTTASLLLWRIYMHHEVKFGRSERLKSLLYAAIQAFPWAKCIYMTGVKYLPNEISEILDIAMDKEVRIHLPLEELELLLHK